jgi:hypothetical protein
MVQIAPGSGLPAAGGGTSGVAGVDQVLQLAAGTVTALGLSVMAWAADDHVQGDAQGSQNLVGRGAGEGRRPRAVRAAVGGGGPVGVQSGHASPGPRVPGCGSH